MIYVADTNFLLRLVNPLHPLHSTVRLAFRRLKANGDLLRATAQNFIEFWNVSTRPVNRNGFGLTPAQANQLLRRAESASPLLPDSPAIYPQWKRFVITFGVSGVQVHDARLAAAMLAHRVTHLLTFNTADFARYAPEGIVAVHPSQV